MGGSTMTNEELVELIQGGERELWAKIIHLGSNNTEMMFLPDGR